MKPPKKPKPEGYIFGRPPKYTAKTFSKKATAYIEERKFGKEKGPITLLDFCCYAGVYKDYIQEHFLEGTEKEGSNLDFSVPIKMLKTEAENSLQYWSLMGRINPAMAIFSLKNYGWKDKTETELSGAGGKDLFPELTPKQLKNIAGEMIKKSEI